MISPELAKKIRHIHYTTNRAVNTRLSGEYESVFKGQGIEFEEVREYQPGDDVRSIDWNVTARSGKPYIKRYVEERELNIMFLVDLSGSGTFGSGPLTKNEVAAEVCALLAFSAIKNNDRVGLIIFTEHVEMFIPPSKGTRHVLRIIRELLYFNPYHSRTNISGALEYLGRVSKQEEVVFLVSDFIDSGYEKQLTLAAKQHDLIAVQITDPKEIELPAIGMIEFEDAETGETRLIDTSHPRFRQGFKASVYNRQERLKGLLTKAGADFLRIDTHQDYVNSIIQFFLFRERRTQG